MGPCGPKDHFGPCRAYKKSKRLMHTENGRLWGSSRVRVHVFISHFGMWGFMCCSNDLVGNDSLNA